MKKVLCSILAFIFVIGIFFSAPITIEAFAVENEVVVKNTNLILPDEKTGIYRYQLTTDESGYILHGPVVNTETGTIHGSVSGDITLPTVHPDDGKPVVELADNAFMYAGGITSVTIPGNYKKIGAYVFCDTPSLTSVTLLDGVEEIGMYAFSDCSNLVNVTFPDSVTKVGEGVLSETAYAGWSNGEWNPNENWINDVLFVGNILIDGLPNRYAYGPNEYAVKYGTKTIADKAMYNYDRVYDVIIPETVENIGEKAFGYRDSTANIDGVVVTEIVKVENFTIYGTKGTAAETYAEENGFKFEESDVSKLFQYKLSEDGESYKIVWYSATDNYSDIVIPSEYNGKPVTEIGESVLAGRSAVVSITVPDSIEVIGSYAFAYCPNLERIILPEKPLKIGANIIADSKYYNNQDNWSDNALYINNHLLVVDKADSTDTFVVKNNTTDIAANAFCPNDGFQHIYNFTTLELPFSLEYIGAEAFKGCSLISTILTNGENKVKEIGDNAFTDCTNLANFPFSKIEKIGMSAFSGVEGIETLVLPNTLKNIETNVFSHSSIASVYIPESVISIGDYAFTGSKLTEVVIGENVEKIGESAFYDCNNLKTVSISSSVESIGANAFSECDILESISVSEDNEKFSAINGVLYNKDKTEIILCPPKALTSYIIPANLQKIPSDFFVNSKITTVTVEPGNENFVVEDGVLYSKDKKTLIFCSKEKSGDFIVPETVTKVIQNAFEGCNNLTSVEFNSTENLVAIEKQTFKNCEEITKVVLPNNLTTIQAEAFYGCKKLSDINIPDTVSYIGSAAFQESAITTITIPKNMTRIGEYAFYKCGNAVDLVIHDKVEYIEQYAFSCCSKLEEIEIPENVQMVEYKAFSECSSLKIVAIYAKKIGKEVFNGCTVLNEIILKDTIQTIYKQSFIGTSLYNNWNGTDDLYLYVDNDETKPKIWLAAGSNTEFNGDYTLPTDIITFASGIFEYTTLSDITIPGNIKSLPDYAFDMCTFNSIILNEGLEYIGVEALGWKSYTGETHTQLVLPSTLKNIEEGAFTWYQVDEYVVTEGENNNFISEDGFVYDKDKTVIYAVPNVYTSNDIYKMPDTVERFNGDVFYNRSVWAVELSDSFKALESGMFKHHVLNKIILPEGITTIPDECFYGTSIGEIVIPSTVTRIGDRAFKDCYSLKSVILPQNLQKIGEGAFEYCTSLNSINLSETKVKNIGDSCFEYCTSLKGISMPETLEEIPERCFASCNALSGVLFGNVTEIAPSAFFGCSSLKDVIVPEAIEEIGDLALGYADPNAPVQATYNLRTPKLHNSARTTFTARASSEENVLAKQMEDFVIYGEKGSEAEQYAKENDFEFKDSDGVHFHVEGQWEIVKQATCAENGEKVRHCADETCDYIYPDTEIIWCTGHNYSSWVITESTCTSSGKKVFDCTVDGCDYYTEEKIQKLPHNFGEDGLCTSCGKTETECIESEHPYASDMDKKWVISKEGAKRIAITFSENTSFESDFDFLYIYNTTYNEAEEYYAEYTGNSLAGKRIIIPTETGTVVIRLVSDSGAEEYGFAITNIEYFYDECNHAETKLINQKEATCTKGSYSGDTVCANDDCLNLIEAGTYGDALGHNFDGNTCSRCGTGMWSYSFYDDTEDEPTEIVINGYRGSETELTIPVEINGYKVVGIESFAFSNTDIVTVVIPDTVQRIGALAFAGCSLLKTVTIPATVINIGQQAFGYLYHEGAGEYILKIEGFTIYGVEDSEAQRYAIENGFKFIVADEHTCVAGTEWLTENGYHYHKCESECDAKLDKADCSGGTATCKKKPICSTCEKEYGECDTTKHVEIVFGGTVGVHQKCKDCGVTTSTKHTLKESIQDSTCSKEGIKTFTCDCGYSYTVDVDKKAHTPINGGEKGIHSKCKDCGATLSTQHTYSRSETKATCEKAGTVKFSCSCGYYYTETTKATGHNSNTKITGKAATCTATGLTDGAKCSVCGKVTVEQKEIAKLSHNQNTKIAGKAATCTATGLTEGTKCSVCGTVTKAQQVIPATGHNQNTKIPAVAATCTKAGLTEGAKCSVCGTVTKAQQTIAATGHKITVVNKKDATTKEAGYTGDKVCSVCNAVTEKGTVIPKIIVSLATPNVAIKNTAKGIEVSWNAIENAQSYVIYRRVYDATTKKWSGWNKLKTGHTSTSYVDGTVVLGTGYRYTVRAVNGDIMSAYTSTSTLKYNVIPTVKVANTGNGIKVTWSTVANATGYTVYSSTYNTKTKKWSNWSNRGTAKATSTSWVDKKASSGVQYKYTVRACNGANIKSSYKASANLIYLAQPTVKIANASNGVRVSWNKIAGATSYYVYSAQFNPTTNKWSNWTNRGTVTKTSWTDTAAQSGVTYRYTVRAINGKTLSSYKATAGLICLAQPTVKIANASTGVKVSWSQSAGASGYTVYRAELVNGKWSNWKNMGTAKAEKSSWVDKSAKSGTKYKYTVRAVNGSVKSTYKATGELLYLAQPTVTVKAVSNGINVAWTQCTGAKGYTVYRAELVNGKWSNWKNMGTAKAEKSSWIDTTAQSGVTYRYTVRAVNGSTRSTYKASENVNR